MLRLLKKSNQIVTRLLRINRFLSMILCTHIDVQLEFLWQLASWFWHLFKEAHSFVEICKKWSLKVWRKWPEKRNSFWAKCRPLRHSQNRPKDWDLIDKTHHIHSLWINACSTEYLSLRIWTNPKLWVGRVLKKSESTALNKILAYPGHQTVKTKNIYMQ